MLRARGVERLPPRALFLDEAVGALDRKNAKEYIRMLRHAMELGGFYQVIFICHQLQVWEMADRTLYIRNGQVLVESERIDIPTTGSGPSSP